MTNRIIVVINSLETARTAPKQWEEMILHWLEKNWEETEQVDFHPSMN